MFISSSVPHAGAVRRTTAWQAEAGFHWGRANFAAAKRFCMISATSGGTSDIFGGRTG